MSEKKSKKILVVTTTFPDSLTIREAANLSNRQPRQIHGDCDRGTLSWGYLMDKTEEVVEGTGERDKENHGQRVVIKDDKWDAYLLSKQESDKSKQ